MVKFGKFGELSLLGKLRKEWKRHHSRVVLPQLDRTEPDTVTDTLSVCAVFKNERPYLAEWIEFHRLVGVERFYLYDNESTDGGQDALRPWVDVGIVQVIPWPKFIADSNPQYLAYAHAAALTADKTRWLAFIDVDEFLFPVEQDDLRPLLAELEDAGSIGVYRREFPFSGHVVQPDGPVISNYEYTKPLRRLDRSKYKSVVSPHLVTAVGSAHEVELAPGARFLDEDLAPIRKNDKGQFEIRANKMRVNHYRTKSEAEFHEKLQRGRMIDRPDWEAKVTRGVKKMVSEATEKDTTIQRFLPELERRLAILEAGAIPPAPAVMGKAGPAEDADKGECDDV